MARNSSFGEGTSGARGESGAVQPRVAKDERGRSVYIHPLTGESLPSNTNAAEWSGVVVPRSKSAATAPVDTAVRSRAIGTPPEQGKIIEEGIRELSRDELRARASKGATTAPKKNVNQEILDAHVKSTGREIQSNNQLITTGLEHHAIMQAKVTELAASHADHPVVSTMVKEAQNHLDAAAAQMHHARGLTTGRRTEIRAANDQARPHITRGLSSLMDAHDMLTHPTMSANGVGSPAIDRGSLETTHGIASAQERHSGFKEHKAARVQDIGGGVKIDRSTPEGKDVARQIGRAGRNRVAGVDVNVAADIARTPATPLRFRESEKDSREAAGLPRGDTSVQDPKKKRSTPQSNVNVPKAQISTTTGNAGEKPVFVPGGEGPKGAEYQKTYTADQLKPYTAMPKPNPAALDREMSRRAKNKGKGPVSQVSGGFGERKVSTPKGPKTSKGMPYAERVDNTPSKPAVPQNIADALKKINKKSRGGK